jgi:hypothetical protein
VAVLIAFGAFDFTVRSIPDRMVEGTGRAQMQVVGLLGHEITIFPVWCELRWGIASRAILAAVLIAVIF